MPGPVPTPNITLTITPPSGSPASYTNNLAWGGGAQQMSVSQNFGRQGDTASIPLVDDWQGRTAPNFYIPVLSRVNLFDVSANTTLFAGLVTAPVLTPAGANRNDWTLQCTDFTYLADNAVVQGTFKGLSIDEIIVLLTQQANCGITATKVADGGFVAKAPTLTQVNFNWVTLSSAWRTLAQLASSSTPYGWYVDQNKQLHFFDATTAINSGASFTTLPSAATVNGSFTEGHYYLDSTFSYEWDGTSIRNKVIVQGANQVVSLNLKGAPTDMWRADGTQTSWPLRYTITGSPALTVNEVSASVVVVNAGGTAPASGWSIQQNAIGQWFLINPSAPGAGTILKMWYAYQIPIVVQSNDFPSQAQYGAVLTEYIQDTSLTTASMALSRAQRERVEYAFAAERITFNTTQDFLGWVRAGETFTVTNSLVPDSQNSFNWGITNATFLCISNSVSFASGGYRSMNITGVRL